MISWVYILCQIRRLTWFFFLLYSHTYIFHTLTRLLRLVALAVLSCECKPHIRLEFCARENLEDDDKRAQANGIILMYVLNSNYLYYMYINHLYHSIRFFFISSSFIIVMIILQSLISIIADRCIYVCIIFHYSFFISLNWMPSIA